MLQYDRIDVLEGIRVNKTNASKECDICHYWHFLEKGFEYEPDLCNGCHDLMQRVINFNDVSIVYVKRNDYRIYFLYKSRDHAINIMKKVDCYKFCCCTNIRKNEYLLSTKKKKRETIKSSKIIS